MKFTALHQILKIVPSVPPLTHAAGVVNGSAVSLLGRPRVALVVLEMGAVAAAHTVDVAIEHRLVEGSGAWVPTLDDASVALAFAQRTNADPVSLYGLLPLGEIDAQEMRAVSTVVGASGVAHSVSFLLSDWPEVPYASPHVNAFKTKIGVAARI